jgi:hypothetical protein
VILKSANAIGDEFDVKRKELTLAAVAENALRCAAPKIDRETWRVANILKGWRGWDQLSE